MKSECKKFGENSRQMAPVSKICDEYFSPYNEPEISALGTPVLSNVSQQFVSYIINLIQLFREHK